MQRKTNAAAEPTRSPWQVLAGNLVPNLVCSGHSPTPCWSPGKKEGVGSVTAAGPVRALRPRRVALVTGLNSWCLLEVKLKSGSPAHTRCSVFCG